MCHLQRLKEFNIVLQKLIQSCYNIQIVFRTLTLKIISNDLETSKPDTEPSTYWKINHMVWDTGVKTPQNDQSWTDRQITRSATITECFTITEAVGLHDFFCSIRHCWAFHLSRYEKGIACTMWALIKQLEKHLCSYYARHSKLKQGKQEVHGSHSENRNELTAYTCFAPPLAQRRDRTPVPAPTSRTTLSWNRKLF